MKNILRNSTIGLAVLFSSLFIMHAPLAVADDCSSSIKTAISCGTGSGAGVNSGTQTPDQSLNSTISEILNILSIAAGVAAVIMIVIAGVRFTTSAGNQESVAAARRSIVYAVIGLVIVALAQIIVHFVLHNLNNATTGQTDTPTSQTPSTNNGGSTNPGSGNHQPGNQL